MNAILFLDNASRLMESVIEGTQLLLEGNSWCFRTFVYGEEVDYSYGRNCPFITFPLCMIWFLILIFVIIEVMTEIFSRRK